MKLQNSLIEVAEFARNTKLASKNVTYSIDLHRNRNTYPNAYVLHVSCSSSAVFCMEEPFFETLKINYFNYALNILNILLH